ncbi:carbohydrate kinase family protein [Gordoniibacillus kamchatkensis]|uniref:carbohydrate kinase family protein n=1 Tax=Gordoniibacillus kamchatkensis TaxID=1590651 RepID=UPI000A85AAF8|nr:PfkB family carbohydrate kinase [Paenibacillus sp. VKM B-2647]
MKHSYDIVGVGVPYLDIVVQVAEIPERNQSAPIAGYKLSGGGKVPTALVAASRLGLSTTLVAGVANDMFGETIRRELEREGVSLQYLTEAEHSAVSVVLVDDATRSRTILYSESEAPVASIFESDRMLDARLLQISASGNAERAAIGWAKAKRIPIMLDADYYDPAFARMAQDVTLFIGSEHYFDAWMPGHDLMQKMDRIRQAGSPVVVVTQGEKGCMLLDDNGLQHVPAFAVDVVDTTGAGDVFHGAFAVGFLKGWSAHDSCVFASAVSAMKCRSVGGRAGIPNIEEVKLFLRDHYGQTLLF